VLLRREPDDSSPSPRRSWPEDLSGPTRVVAQTSGGTTPGVARVRLLPSVGLSRVVPQPRADPALRRRAGTAGDSDDTDGIARFPPQARQEQGRPVRDAVTTRDRHPERDGRALLLPIPEPVAGTVLALRVFGRRWGGQQFREAMGRPVPRDLSVVDPAAVFPRALVFGELDQTEEGRSRRREEPRNNDHNNATTIQRRNAPVPHQEGAISVLQARNFTRNQHVGVPAITSGTTGWRRLLPTYVVSLVATVLALPQHVVCHGILPAVHGETGRHVASHHAVSESATHGRVERRGNRGHPSGGRSLGPLRGFSGA